MTGPSGAGKGTLIRELVNRVPELEVTVSATTRERRPGEVDGREYWFLTPEEFLARFSRLAGMGRSERDHIRFGRNQAGLLDALLATQPEVRCDETFARVRDQLRSFACIEPAAQPASNPAFTVYSHVVFADPRHGMILGAYVPRSTRQEANDDSPERALTRRQVPRLMLNLDTRDGGTTWTSTTAPLFGSVNSLRLGGSSGLAVFNYMDSFEWPAEVYRIDLTTGKSESVFRQKDRRVTDAAIFADGSAFLAAVEPPGSLRSAPIPGKVKILESRDLKNWEEMRVDYRALARSLVLSGPDPGHLWAATDTGMILRLSLQNK